MARLAPEYVVAGLVQRGVPEHVAQGVVMNFRDESGLDTGIQEKAPLAGRGGFGLAQWTGPRRIALEDFARTQGKRIDDPDVQLDFFMHENQGYEAPAWKQVMASPTAQDAAIAFVNKWERPTTAHAAARSAKYAGQNPGGPVEAAGGGAGNEAGEAVQTGAPALVPDAFFTAPNAPTAPAPAAPPGMAESKSLMGNLGSLAAGKAGQLPVSRTAQIAAPMTQQSWNPAANTSTQDQLRDQLSVAMQRLNSGKLFG